MEAMLVTGLAGEAAGPPSSPVARAGGCGVVSAPLPGLVYVADDGCPIRADGAEFDVDVRRVGADAVGVEPDERGVELDTDG